MTVKDIKHIQEDGRVFVDMPNDDSNPCLNCGVCCTHFRISFYFGEMDIHPMGFVPSEKTSKINEFFACMKGTENGGRCIALQGNPGEKISCEIYSNRPSSCREFPVFLEDGSPNPKCNELRVKHGIPPIPKTTLNININ